MRFDMLHVTAGRAVPDERNRVADRDCPAVRVAQRELQVGEAAGEGRPELSKPLVLRQEERPGAAMERLELSFQLRSLAEGDE